MGVGLPMHRPGVPQRASYLLGAAPPKMLRVRLETSGYKVPAAFAPGSGGMALLEPHSYRDGFSVCAWERGRSQRPRVVQPDILARDVYTDYSGSLPSLLIRVIDRQCVKAGWLQISTSLARIKAGVDRLYAPRDFIQRLVAGIKGRAGTVPRRRGVLGYVVCIE